MALRCCAAVLALLLLGCGTFDRADQTVDTAVQRLEAATSRSVVRAGEELRRSAAEAVDAAVTRLEAAPARALDGAAEAASAKLDAAASRLTAGMDPATKSDFDRLRAERGLLPALREFWVEILVALFGGGGFLRGWLDRRHRERAEREAAEQRRAAASLAGSLARAPEDLDGDGQVSAAERFRAGLARSARERLERLGLPSASIEPLIRRIEGAEPPSA